MIFSQNLNYCTNKSFIFNSPFASTIVKRLFWKIIWNYLSVLSVFTGSSFNHSVFLWSTHSIISIRDSFFLLLPLLTPQSFACDPSSSPGSFASTSWNSFCKSSISLCHRCGFYVRSLIRCCQAFFKARLTSPSRGLWAPTPPPATNLRAAGLGGATHRVLPPAPITLLPFSALNFPITMKCHQPTQACPSLPSFLGQLRGTVYIALQSVPSCSPRHLDQ